MNITLENIDELRKRANVGYKEAKEALVECDGDMVEAIIYIEEKFGVKDQQKVDARKHRDNIRKDRAEKRRQWEQHKKHNRKHVDSLSKMIHNAFDYCNTTRFVIYNQYRTVIDIPLTLAIIMGMVINVFAVMIVVTAIVTDHKIKLVRKDNGANEINDILNKVQKAAHDVTETIKTSVNIETGKKESVEKDKVDLDKNED